MTLNIIKDEKNGLGKWLVIADAKTWKNQQGKAKSKLIAQVEIPGFRKGKVPTKMAEKHVTEAQILQAATKATITIAYDYALKQKPNLMPINQPEVKIEKSSTEECEIMFLFDLPAAITIGKYRDINIDKPVATVNQPEIDAKIKLLQDKFAIYQSKETGKLAKGDISVFNFTGFLNDQKFPGGEAKDMELEIGSGKFIPGFEEGMIGMMPKTKKTIEVTFPEDYHVPNLKGQLVKFEIELLEIKNKIINEDLAELVKDVNMPNVTTSEQLLANIKKEIELEKTMTIKEQFMEELITKIVKDSKITIPAFAIKNETERLENEFKKQLANQNFTIENYITATGLSHEDITNEIQKDAITQLQNFLVIEEIIKLEKIKISEEEIQNQLQKLAEQFNVTIEEVKENIKDLNLVTTTLKRNKAFDLLWENNGKMKKETTSA